MKHCRYITCESLDKCNHMIDKGIFPRCFNYTSSKELYEERLKTMKCNYCDINSDDCEYFQDFADEWYQDIETQEWDNYDDDYIHIKNYGVRYCQYCGRELV